MESNAQDVVVVGDAVCRDASTTDLSELVQGHAATLTLRFQKTPLSVVANLEGAGLHESRTFTSDTANCTGLMRALRVWVSLHVDNAPPPTQKPEPEKPQPVPAWIPEPPKPIAAAPDRAVPQDPLPPPPRGTLLDVGLAPAVMTGLSRMPFAGGAVSASVAIGGRNFIRPSVVALRALPGFQDASGWALLPRADLCTRLRGAYVAHHGLRADLCAGVETGVVEHGDSVKGHGAVGPAVALGGELSKALRCEVRGTAGVHFMRPAAAPPFSARGELVLAWSF